MRSAISRASSSSSAHSHDARASRPAPCSESTAPSPCAACCCGSPPAPRRGCSASSGSSARACTTRAPGKSLLEVEDVADVGAAPAVDRLVGIAADRDVLRGRSSGAAAACTGRGWCPGTRRRARGGSGRRTGRARPGAVEELDHLEQEVVEVERVVARERRVVLALHTQEDLVGKAADSSRLRAAAAVLAVADEGADLGRLVGGRVVTGRS
jgi:hypothetical protein